MPTYFTPIPNGRVNLADIKREVCRFYGVTRADMDSHWRARRIARPRQIAMSISREMTRRSLPAIGSYYGGRDHTTVLHAVKRIAELRTSDPLLDEDYSNLKWAIAYGENELLPYHVPRRPKFAEAAE